MPTQKQLSKLLRLIERDNACKVVGFVHDDMEPFYKLDVLVSTPAFLTQNYLFEFHFDRVDFANKTMRFLVFDDEMEEVMKTVGLADDPAEANRLLS